MNAPALGRLERVNVRTAWATEAQAFTPWLAQAENITLLGEVIGLDLEVEAQEKSVGPFRADILCRDTVSGHFVLIENQLERTDHTHLGQLITYAAGLDAVTIVWVATPFTDEHRAALDWLNRVTNEAINFFGLEIELWRIGDSPVAPKFNIVSQPNDWQKTVATFAAATGGPLTETQQLYLDYWTQFRQFMEDRTSPVKMNKPSKDSWTSIAVGRSGFAVNAWNVARDDRSGLQLAITGPLAKQFFHILQTMYRSEIEAKLGPVEWRELPHAKESQVGITRSSTLGDRASWPELNQWMADHIERWVEVFRPLVQTLEVSGQTSSESTESDAPNPGTLSHE